MAAIGAHIPRSARKRSPYPFVKVFLHTPPGGSAAVPEGDPYIAEALARGAVIVARREVYAPGKSREIPLNESVAADPYPPVPAAARIRARAAVAREFAAEQAEASELRRTARRAAAVVRRETQRRARIAADTDRATIRARRAKTATVPGPRGPRIAWLDALVGRA